MDIKGLVLLSGGLDSATCLSVAHKKGYKLYTVSFDYNQRHKRELKSAELIAQHYDVVDHKIFKVDLIGGNALTDRRIEVPNYTSNSLIPVTYVPARNILFLSYALGYAETISANAIFIGVSSIDYSGYPDCRPEFIEAFQKVVDLGTKAGVEGDSIQILTPLINLSKAETIQLALENRVPLHLTTSCYNGKEKACGSCDSCVLRLRGFEQVYIEDPIDYQ